MISKLFFYSQTIVKVITFSILHHFQWENDHNPLWQIWITIKSQPFPPKKLDPLVLSIWIGYQINWIISEVQVSKFFFSFFQHRKSFLLAPLRSRIGTCSGFCHSFSVSSTKPTSLTCSHLLRNQDVMLEVQKIRINLDKIRIKSG